LLLIIVAIAGFFFGADAVRASLIAQFREMLGESGSQALEAMLQGAASSTSGAWSAVIGIVLLLVAALGVVVQMRDALNTIFEAKEPDNAGIGWYTRVYGVSFAGILALGFLLAISLVISTALAAFSSWIGGSVGQGALLAIVNFAVSLGVLSILFAMLFKWFPDVEIAWHDVWPGAIATALLFNIGKAAISWYIGTQGLESTYGAAGSIVVLLVWVYYSAQIVLAPSRYVGHPESRWRARSCPRCRPSAGHRSQKVSHSPVNMIVRNR
jgi:membrane protein